VVRAIAFAIRVALVVLSRWRQRRDDFSQLLKRACHAGDAWQREHSPCWGATGPAKVLRLINDAA
jgi:hypothetical protein